MGRRRAVSFPWRVPRCWGVGFRLEPVEFGQLSYPGSLRIVIPAVTLIMLGMQVIFTSFLIRHGQPGACLSRKCLYFGWDFPVDPPGRSPYGRRFGSP